MIPTQRFGRIGFDVTRIGLGGYLFAVKDRDAAIYRTDDEASQATSSGKEQDRNGQRR